MDDASRSCPTKKCLSCASNQRMAFATLALLASFTVYNPSHLRFHCIHACAHIFLCIGHEILDWRSRSCAHRQLALGKADLRGALEI